MACAIETRRFHEFRGQKGVGGTIVVSEWSCSECSGNFGLYMRAGMNTTATLIGTSGGGYFSKLQNSPDWIPKTCPYCSRPFDEWKELAGGPGRT